MKYCKITTEEHSLSTKYKVCLQAINRIIINEGGKNEGFENEHIALNLDDVQKKQNRAERNSSMDICFGISEDTKNRKLVLVDFKLNHKMVKSIGKSDLEKKVNDSKSLLGNEIPIMNEYFFVFRDNLKEQARSHFKLLFSGKPKIQFCPLKVFELKEKFFI
jgi:hypothetical protein